MQHRESHLNVNQEENSCRMAAKERSNLSQKQNSESGNHTSILDSVSPETEPEPYNLQQRQCTDATNDVSESHEEEKTVSYKVQHEKDSEMLIQKPSSSAGLSARASNQPLVINRMRDSPKIPRDKLANLHFQKNPDSGLKTSAMCDAERTSSVKKEMEAGILLRHSDGQKLTHSAQPEKSLKKLQSRRNPDAGGCSSPSDHLPIPHENLSIVPKEEPQPNNSPPTPRQTLDARNHALLRKEEKSNTDRGSVSQSLVQVSSLSVGMPVPQSDKENYTYSKKLAKVEKLQPRRNPDAIVQESQSDAESNPSKVPDKGLDDGYNWRKYGQKLVKGNKYIRSYYRCTYPNCQAKKQVERSHDGCKTDVNYLGNHHHQKPQHSPQVTSAFQTRIPEMAIVPASKTNAEPIGDHGGKNQPMMPTETSTQSIVARVSDGVTGSVSCSNNDHKDKDDYPDSKRRKRDITSVDGDVVDKSNSYLRHVVQTQSEVDIINDGYRWRKYGQKLVKGNPNPRSYYRCSNAGCPVKKHVERASHDPKVVVTTYEGKHDHDMPPSRTVNQSVARGDSANGESSSKPQEKSPVSLEMVVHVSAN